jgi:hypothetical protein
VREREGVSLHYHGGPDEDLRQGFERWWLGQSPDDLPCHFWGDLDFSGMAILKTLRQRVPGTQSWQPGYKELLKRIAQGHPAEAASKQEQVDPGTTGCPYADQVLLPALRQRGLCVDQEILRWDTFA